MRTIEYMRRKNLGHYEHEELKISDVVGDQDSIDLKINELKHLVLKHLGLVEEAVKEIELPVTPEVTEVAEEKKEEPVKKAKKKKVKEEVVEEKVEEEKHEEKVQKKPAKTVDYDRTLQVHKNLLGKFLDESFPRWKSPDNLKKASEASHALNGTPFLDENGEILQDFKDKFVAIMV